MAFANLSERQPPAAGANDGSRQRRASIGAPKATQTLGSSSLILEPKTREMPETMLYRILMLMPSYGPVRGPWTAGGVNKTVVRGFSCTERQELRIEFSSGMQRGLLDSWGFRVINRQRSPQNAVQSTQVFALGRILICPKMLSSYPGHSSRMQLQPGVLQSADQITFPTVLKIHER